MTTGYAVYWIPPASDPLSDFGFSWTGWCPDAGEKHPRIGSPAKGLDLGTITRETCLHGFHGVLKAPFRLTHRWKIWSLQRSLTLLADDLEEVTVPALKVAVVDGRVALVPKVRSAELDLLALRVREATAPFERPQERRAGSATDDRHAAARSGVEVRSADSFHMPLTDRLSVPSACQIAVRIRPMLTGVLGGSHALGDFALVTDPGSGRRARVAEQYPLSDQTGATGAAGNDAFACRGPRVYAPLNLDDRVAEPTA